MNFTQIYNGMVGRDFIKAFNDNFIISNDTFLSILATLLYTIKSTDIKEFKVINNVVSYTLEEAPESGPDTRTWTPVDITAWGNITGNLTDQTDLKNALDAKAAADTVSAMDTLLNNLNRDFGTLSGNVANDEITLNNHTNQIATLTQSLNGKVSSTNIVAIRLNNAVFEWSPDGTNWYSQSLVTQIPWGNITGNLTDQTDLNSALTNINNSINGINNDITGLGNDIGTVAGDVTALDTTLTNHIADYNSFVNTTTNDISAIDQKADTAISDAGTVSTALGNHIADYNNPHHVTKNTINLGNVDNTADINKPLSTPQQTYVDNQIAAVRRDLSDLSGVVSASGFVSNLFVGNSTEYASVPKIGTLALIVDNTFLITNVQLVADAGTYTSTDFDLYKNGTIVTETSSTAETKIYHGLQYNSSDTYMVKVNISGTLTPYNIELSFNSDNVININELVEGGNA